MRKYYLLILLLACSFSSAQVINFPDPVFKAKLLEADVTNDIAQDASNNNIKIDVNSNGEIEQSEALLVYSLFYTSGPPIRPASQTSIEHANTTLIDAITDVTGILYFTNLRQLDLSDNQIPEIDLSNLSALQGFKCRNSGVQSLDISGTPALAYLDCAQNQLTELALAGHPLLQTIYCNDNQLTELFTSGLTNLQFLVCNNNALTAIHFGGNPILTRVYCYFNQLTEINLANTSAVVLYCNDNPNLTTIKVKNNVDSPLIFDEFPAPPIDAFNFSNLPSLETVCCDAGEASVIAQFLASQPTVSVTTDCLPPNIISFADRQLKNALVTTICANYEADGNYDNDADLNDDGEIDFDEALLIRGLSIGANGITNLQGLQYFENLIVFGIGGNPLTSFSGFGLQNLTNLYFIGNQLSDVDLSELLALENFQMREEPLTDIDFSNNQQLHFARFWQVPVTSLNFCGTSLAYFDGQDLPDLVYFSCKNGIITTDGIWPQTPPPLSPIQLYDTPSLQTVCYDAGEIGFINWGDAIPGANYVTDCPSDCSILKTDTINAQTLAIYPNPAKDTLTVKTVAGNTIQTITIFNSLGQKIAQVTDTTFDVSGLPTGTYFIKVVSSDGQHTQKFIKL